jgi:hypothetical protein
MMSIKQVNLKFEEFVIIVISSFLFLAFKLVCLLHLRFIKKACLEEHYPHFLKCILCVNGLKP